MTVVAPKRSLDQRLEALARANDVRIKRARLKRALAAGDASAAALLRSVPDYIATMRVLDLLTALPKIGRVKAARLINVHRISSTKTVGGLSSRQRDELAAALEARR